MKYITGFSALLIAALGIAPALADGLIANVNGITLDEKGEVIRFNALQISANGNVTKLLRRKDKPPKQLDFKYDGKGQTMLPAFVDAHGNVMDIGFTALTLDISAASSLAKAQAMIADYAAKNPDRRWIVGRGWNHHKWNLGRFPNAADLQSPEILAASGGRPIWLIHADGQAGWANIPAMQVAKINGQSKAPSGGRIEKIAGKASGIFIGSATQIIQKNIPAPRPAERDIALGKAQKTLLSRGIASIADMGTRIEDWQSYRRAGDAGWLNIRIFGYADGTKNMVDIAGPAPSPWLYDDKLRLGGVLLRLDGALASKGAWLKSPYAGNTQTSGMQILGSAELRNLMVRASMDGFQTAIKASGNAAGEEAIYAVGELAETFKGDRRWRIENMQYLDDADNVRLGKLGIIASIQPHRIASDKNIIGQHLGSEHLGTALAGKSILAAGGKLIFGSGAPASPANGFAAMAAAITREDRNGQPFGGWQPSERLSRNEALAAYTIAPAHAAFAETKVGSLTPGHKADFILVDKDPLLVSTREIRDIVVNETWVGGRPAYKRGGANGASEDRVRVAPESR